MDQLTVDDLKKTMKFLSVSLGEDRLKAVASFLNQSFEALKPLTQRHLPKELEPTGYLKLLETMRDE